LKEKEKEKEREKPKPFMPELKKEAVSSPISEALGIRSEIKAENVYLTESIEMTRGAHKEEKKKPSTFM
jgi:hypothetical protein